MATAPEHSVGSGEIVYRSFVDACKPMTRVLYVQALHYFMDYFRISREDYEGLRRQKD
jgi:hypothetical protein